MNAAGTVTRFTTHLGRVRAGRPQARVRGGFEIASDILVALRAILRPDERGAGNLRRHHDRPFDRGARDDSRCEQQYGHTRGPFFRVKLVPELGYSRLHDVM